MRRDHRLAQIPRLCASASFRCVGAGLLLHTLAACSASGQVEPELEKRCQDPRPQMCTLEYAPVCGFLGNDQWREYSNGCSACADPEVAGYVSGPCPAP